MADIMDSIRAGSGQTKDWWDDTTSGTGKLGEYTNPFNIQNWYDPANILGFGEKDHSALDALQEGFGGARNAIQGGYQRAGEYYDPFIGMADMLPGLQQRVAGGEFRSQAPGIENFNFNYEESPGYQYAVDQGLGQVNRNMGARGLSESGAELKGLTRMATGLAQQDYGNQRQLAFGEHRARQGDRFGLANMGNRFNQQQLSNELGFGKMGMGAIGERAGMETGLADLLAQLQIGEGQAVAGQAAADAEADKGIGGNIMSLIGSLFGAGG